jgi:fructosamine-3-kinase
MSAEECLPDGATRVRRIAGGDLNAAFRVTLADGREAFVKTRQDVSPEEYPREASDLEWLAEAGGLPTPAVIEVSERSLVLEWVAPGVLDRGGEEELGRGLAVTHRAGTTCFGRPVEGPGSAASFGSLRLPNEPSGDWASFYATNRLEPLARIARERAAISERCLRAVGVLCRRMDELVGPPEPPARLHGDLWSGNVLAGEDGRPWLIDPSAYGGHREMDLAMLRLFGGPSERTFAAYAEVLPPAAGWEERVGLCQLAPLLVHAALFGGSYGAAAERVALRYAG